MKYCIFICLIFLTACGSTSTQKASIKEKKEPISITEQQAGYIYSTFATSLKLASTVVGYCRDIGAKGYQETDEDWTSNNRELIKAVSFMMDHKAPDPKMRNSIEVGMDSLAERKATEYINSSIKNSSDPIASCEKAFELIRAGNIDIGKQKFVREVLESYL